MSDPGGECAAFLLPWLFRLFNSADVCSAVACCLRIACFASVNVTVGTLFKPDAGVLLITAPEVPLAFIIDFVMLTGGLAGLLTGDVA